MTRNREGEEPKVDSRASFAAAAKHLFRHLHDARALRKNPLVCRYFANGETGPSGGRETAALGRIHEAVRRGAERCRDADLREGLDERALRQYAIVTQQCLERRPIEQVAAALGISSAHCYRERAAACRRVAHYIVERDAAPVLDPLPILDEFRFFADQTMHRAEFGDADAVFRECDQLVRNASSPQERIEALRIGASVAAQFGDFARVKAARLAAHSLWAREFEAESSSASEIAAACIDLIDLELGLTVDPVQVFRAAGSATKRLEPFVMRAPMRIREMYVESLFNLGLALANLGSFEKGFEHVVNAEALLDRIHPVSAQLRSWALVEVWRGRNRLLMSSQHWLPAWQREEGLRRAFEFAYSSGSFAAATRSLVALTEHHAFAGNDDHALSAGRSAVTMAKRHPSNRILVHSSISAVLPLLSTRHWHEGVALLPATPVEASICAYHRDALAYCDAIGALRSREFSHAFTLATQSAQEYPGVAVRMKLVGAAAAHALQRRKEAHSLIEQGLAAAEDQRSAPILKEAYTLASRIVPDGRFKQQASEVTRLLTA
jgi:hypothetical protein